MLLPPLTCEQKIKLGFEQLMLFEFVLFELNSGSPQKTSEPNLLHGRGSGFADLVAVQLLLGLVLEPGNEVDVGVVVCGNLQLLALHQTHGDTQGRLPQLVLQLLLVLLR